MSESHTQASPETDVAAVRANNLRKTFGDTTALDDVSLSVDSGEVFAFVGPNGAGKTTLVRCLTGTMAPDTGSVSLFSEPPDEFSEERLGLMPQDFDPPNRLTPHELLSYYAGLYDDAVDVAEILDVVGISDVAGTRYAKLSGGERRRTLVGTAIVNDPDLLFLDEPTTGIDPAGRRAIWSLIEELVDAGTTVLLTTHYLKEVERLADRVGLLSNGELLAVDSPRALIERHGGESEIVIRTASRPTLSGYETESIDGGVVIRNVPPAELGAVVESLEAANVDFDSVSWREADLETAYLELSNTESRAGWEGLGGERR